MKRIASFSVDHDKIKEGMYLSRVDGDVYTYDLRTRVPNNDANDYMDNLTMHSLEHMAATYFRNSAYGDRVVYFGPMGCQTGFYLLLDSVKPADALEIAREVFRKIAFEAEEMFGAERKECGNYKNLSLRAAKTEAERYFKVLSNPQNKDLMYD